MIQFQIEPLRTGAVRLLQTCSVKQEQAFTLIDCMLEADMRGVHTHGLSVLPAYIGKLEKGAFNLTTDSVILKSTAAFTTVDASNQIGAVSAERCMRLAIEKCAESGMHSVFCRNANTFGPAFYYAKMAAEKKLIGLCMCNSPSAMPAWGGSKKVLGTNPFAVAFPAKELPPVVVDMATSVVAKSKINELRKNGKPIPAGWAVDENGQPTTDPVAAIRGMVLPMAGHKGSAIAMSIDILSGVLSGAGYLNGVNRFYSDDPQSMNVGHCFIAIDPAAVSEDDFCEKMDEYIREIHRSGEAVLCPGELEHRAYCRALSNGVELFEETAAALEELFAQKKITEALMEHAG